MHAILELEPQHVRGIDVRARAMYCIVHTVLNAASFFQASRKHAAPAISAPHDPPSSSMTSLVCACIAYREEVQVRQDRSKESAAVSCKRDLRNGVSELTFGHRSQLAIAAGDQHQPL